MKNGFYESNYGKIHYHLIGSGDLPCMVFIHGVGMDHKTFEKQVEHFKGQYRILVWDLPGHGDSSLKNYDKRFTELSAECLNELMEGLEIRHAVFVGQSLGSMVVQHFQIKYPEKVLATVHVPGIELKSHVGAWSKIFVPVMMFLFKLFPSNAFYNSFGRHRAVRKDVQKYLSDSISKTGKKLALDITEDMVYDLIDRSPTPQKSPLLITYGKKDLFLIRSGAKKWHKNAPHSKYIEIKNANHIANQDNPEDFNKAVSEFLTI
jgi:3-oxoadipate enol-lactonase